MPRTPHFELLPDDLRLIEDALHHAPQADLRQRALGIRLLHLGYPVQEVARMLDVAASEVRRWRRVWCKDGIAGLRDSASYLQTPDTFLARLTALQSVGLELNAATTIDELCKQAIEMGLARLGFDRLGIFFTTDKPDYYMPTFGTGEDGKLRDERRPDALHWHDRDDLRLALARQQDLIIRFDCPLYSDDDELIGHGWNVMAALWDGSKIIGFIAADNLIHQKPLTDADIQILRLYGMTLGSLCSLKRTGETLLKERNMLRAVMDSTLDMIYVKDLQSRVIMTNTVSIAKTNPDATEQDMIGLTDFDYMPKDLAQRFFDEEQHLMRTGIPILNREEPGVDDDGKLVTYLTTKVPLRDSQGTIIGLVGVSRNITDIKRDEEQNLRLVVASERVELMEQFISNISHDLKTPLAVIKTSLYLLERLDDPSRQRAKIQSIKEQTERLERLIQDILTVSRLDQVETLIREPVDMGTVIREVADNMRNRIEAKRHTFNLDIAPRLPHIYGNKQDLWRMVANLVENAINYTHSGGQITVEARAEKAGVRISVRDTGMGITEEQLPHIFERFYRADTARSIQNGGTGLGLSIVKLIAEQHDGHIDVQSTLGSGTSFQIWLPCS